MRRILTIILAAIFAISFYSCNQFQELYAPLETEWIRFEAGDIEATGSMETKSLENEITCDITDWDYVEEGEQTKAKLTESLSGSAGVYGFNFASWSESLTPNVMSNEKSGFDGSSLTPEKKHLWKDCTAAKVRFYAYSPYGKFTVSGKDDAGTPYLSFTVPTTNKDQIDILYAQSEDIDNTNRNAVPFQFKHAMCAVQFRLGIDGATLNSVTVSNVKSTGKLSLDGTWSDRSAETTYTISSQDSLLLMIPQTLATGATVTLNYTEGGTPTSISASIAGQEWKIGKKIVYTLKKKPAPGTVEYIYFDFSAGDIILTNTKYSGYVFVDGDTTMVTGTHNPNNKYYVYQSAPAALVPGNAKVWSENTGYQNNSEIGTKNPTLPEYTAIDVDGKSWGEYVTNNTDPAAVLAKWNSFPENFLEPKPRRILIYGDSEFDITLDRVYSRYYPYRGSTNGAGEQYEGVITTAPYTGTGDSRQYRDVYGGITVGQSSLTKYNSSWTDRPYMEKVTIRLKGNNYFSRIEYAKQIEDTTLEGYLKITSEKGDGIAEGTLTVTLPYLRTAHPTDDGLLNFVRCALIGGGANDKNSSTNLLYRQVRNLYFDGGIVYCGVEKIRNSNWTTNENMIPCIGTNNADAEITINGGIITAISNGTGPAIGGGAGWLRFGGKGTVTINGGTVYAYSFGVFNANSSVNAPVMSAAIGGGSSGNQIGAEGVVTINGGTVYASSVGGCAIGGGTSAKQTGGTGTVTVYGGNIFANSISGTIGGSYSATAGVAIGGGRSGISKGYNGGNAIVSIVGGTIVAGSVGGGKCGNATGKLGRAEVTVSGGETSAQFLLVKDKSAATANTFTMTGGVIKNSKTSDTEYVKAQMNGGAVYMESGTCNISGGTIKYCSGALGGAVYMNGGEFSMSGTGKIAECQGEQDGGAVYIEGGNATVSGGEIYHNIASKGNGGGVYVKGGNFTMTGGKVNNNASDCNPEMVGGTYYGGNGGGIYVASTTSDPEVKLLGGEITYNAADRNGGGLCVDMEGSTHNATITIGYEAEEKRDTLSPNIRLNSASLSGGGMSVQGSGSNITIYSGTVKGNVSAFVKNEDIRNDGGTVELIGKNEVGKKPQVNVQYNTITFYANNERDPEPYTEQRVITSTNSPLDPESAGALAFEKEFFHIASWNTKRDGTGTRYKADGSGAVMNITSDVSLYAQWVAN